MSDLEHVGKGLLFIAGIYILALLITFGICYFFNGNEYIQCR